MKRMAFVGLVVAAVTLSLAPSAHAGHRRGPEVDVFVGFGPTYRYAPPPYYYFFYAPPAVVYRAPVVIPAPAPLYLPPPPPAPPAYWHYCPTYGVYYPHVPTCPEPWVPVPAR